MVMLNFKVDWERSPRVRDRLFRATWARLEIHARDGTREICLTDCVGEKSRSLRRGVYGSVFPVARWIVVWSQRASRAFAAELLAPAEELAARATGRVTYDQVAELASEFQVSQMVIEHQLTNHRIASVVDS